MDEQELQACYCDWLAHKIFRFTHEIVCYACLLDALNGIEYTYSVEMDANRYVDGLELKKTFCWEIGISQKNAVLLGDKCSVLEMMVALAVRCEVSIMSDPSVGDRTWLWFQSMLESLKLSNQDNDRFDIQYVEERLNIMLNRLYDEKGNGALFHVINPVYDMRRADVWSQMNWFLSENF